MSETPFSPGARFAPTADVTWQEVEGQVVLLLLTGGEYFRLDDVGSRMWTALLEHGTVPATVATIRDEFDAPAEVLEADLTTLVTELVGAGLLETA
jgi:hypothetical protein